MTATKKAERTYSQYCPIALGLDVVGDRWTLLICRELFMGDQRFTDLRNALTGIAPNLLTERLRSLQGAGLVESVELPPPAARTVYRLTDSGREIGPVLRAMSQFGTRFLEGDVPSSFTAHRAASTLLVAWRRASDTPQRIRVEFEGGRKEHEAPEVVDLEVVDLEVVPGDVRLLDRSDEPVDVVVRTTIEDLVRARQGEPLHATLTGTAAARREFLGTFRLQLAR